MPRRWRLLAAALALSVAAAPATGESGFEAWAERFAADWMRLSPKLATRDQYFDGEEQAALDHRLTPLSDAKRA